MPKRYTGKQIVSWVDNKGVRHEKVLDWAKAQKAVRWLAANGATDIDVASEMLDIAPVDS